MTPEELKETIEKIAPHALGAKEAIDDLLSAAAELRRKEHDNNHINALYSQTREVLDGILKRVFEMSLYAQRTLAATERMGRSLDNLAMWNEMMVKLLIRILDPKGAMIDVPKVPREPEPEPRKDGDGQQ